MRSVKPSPTISSFLLQVFLLAGLSLACASKTDDAAPAKSIHILFVGNSLTYSNDLPKRVQEVAAKQGVSVKTEMLAFPNYALEDHWLEGKVQELIASGRFTYVVVQQGPSSQEEGRTMLIESGKMYSELCKQHKTTLAFFMVWPSKANYHTFEGVIKNYTEAAASTNSLLCPVGKLWKEHFDTTHDFSYYGSDLFHPSTMGSQVAAEVIYESLFTNRTAPPTNRK